jgi:hypothetical protein
LPFATTQNRNRGLNLRHEFDPVGKVWPLVAETCKNTTKARSFIVNEIFFHTLRKRASLGRALQVPEQSFGIENRALKCRIWREEMKKTFRFLLAAKEAENSEFSDFKVEKTRQRMEKRGKPKCCGGSCPILSSDCVNKP